MVLVTGSPDSCGGLCESLAIVEFDRDPKVLMEEETGAKNGGENLHVKSTTNEHSHSFTGGQNCCPEEVKENKNKKLAIVEANSKQSQIKPTKKRYFILAMFVTLHMIKSFQWICLASITNVVAHFYRVDNLAINWTTILFMVTFLFLALPISWIMERIGLRRAVLIGALGVTCGVTIKCFSCYHDGFLVCMLGHLIVGLTEPFFFSSYSQVASVWFPDNQVAMATAWSVVGEELGLALGFIIPPLVIGSNPEDDATIQSGLLRLFISVALISALNTVSIVLFFDEKPKFAPGVARFKQMIQEQKRRRDSQAAVDQYCERKICALNAERRRQSNKIEFVAKFGSEDYDDYIEKDQRNESSRVFAQRARELGQSVRQQMDLSRDILFNKHFVLLLLGFGINMGTVYSIHTLLNQMIAGATPPIIIADTRLQTEQQAQKANLSELVLDQLQQTVGAGGEQRWPNDNANLVVGNTGLISILAGLVGSALCGYLLDKYHCYKLTTVSVYLLNVISMVALTGCLRLGEPLALYLVAVPLGFAFTGYASCGFDYGVEITYPNPELLSSTLLNVSAQVCGIPISLVGSVIVDAYGSEALGLFFCAILTVGFFITCLQGGQLKRQHAVKEGGPSIEGCQQAAASLTTCRT